jgi:hypothetical protein
MAINQAMVVQLREDFHKFLIRTVNSKLSTGDLSHLESYQSSIRRGFEMLAANSTHDVKPGLLELANCMFVYADPYMNFWDAFASDPLVAVWAGHLFWCMLEQDRPLVFCN